MSETRNPSFERDGEASSSRGELRPPISALPVEILTRILREHLTTTVLKPIPERLAPLNAVPHWKAVALNDPRSWTTLCIGIDLNTLKSLGTHLQPLGGMLKAAGRLPVDVYIFHAGLIYGDPDHWIAELEKARSMLKNAFTNANLLSLRSYRDTGSMHCFFQHVLPGLRPSQVNTLTTLVLQNPTITEPVFFPNLQNITLFGDRYLSDNIYNLRSCSSLSCLTLALCTGQESQRKDDILTILGWFPKITTFSADYWHFDNTVLGIPDNEVQFFDPPVRFPSVNSLGVFIHGCPKSRRGVILSMVFKIFYKAGLVTLRMPETFCIYQERDVVLATIPSLLLPTGISTVDFVTLGAMTDHFKDLVHLELGEIRSTDIQAYGEMRWDEYYFERHFCQWSFSLFLEFLYHVPVQELPFTKPHPWYCPQLRTLTLNRVIFTPTTLTLLVHLLCTRQSLSERPCLLTTRKCSGCTNLNGDGKYWRTVVMEDMTLFTWDKVSVALSALLSE